MTLADVDSVVLVVLFLVPGFLWHSVQAVMLPRASGSNYSQLLRFLTFSCFNFGLWVWLLYLLVATDFAQDHPISTALLWFGMLFVSPIVLGGLCAWLTQKGICRSLLSRLGFQSIHTIPTSWDYKFHQIRTATWIQVKLTDGQYIRGRFGVTSFASSSAEERDLYLEKAAILKDGRWKLLDRSDGIWINGDQVKYIEFLPME